MYHPIHIPKTSRMSSVSSMSNTRPLASSNLITSYRILQLLLIVSLLSSTHALIGSDDDRTVQFNKQLLLRSQPASKAKSRLATLLQLRQSIQALMHLRDDIAPNTATTDNDAGVKEDKEVVTEKRVFCNGFTGCGGRFRGRWVQQLALEDMRKRMQKAAASKRPFCNTNGCFNGGKRKKEKKSNNSVLSEKTYFLNDDDFSSDDSSRASSRGSFGAIKDKRLFCNGYGGCRNMGKRGLLLPVLTGERLSTDDYRMRKPSNPVFEITLEPTKEKRFFASSYDSKMDDFLSRINR